MAAHSEKNRAGFSFLELLVALAIGGIVSYLSVISLVQAASATTLKNEANRIAALLELCTIKALLLREDISLKSHPNELIARTISNPKKPLIRRNIRGGTEVRLGRPELRFYASGVASPATIRIQNRSHRCRVVLSLRGRAQVECDKKE